jgi:hypothetical protein
MALTWYRMPAREGETSRIRTSSGSYTIVGIMTPEGKSFQLHDSAGFIGARRSQREAKERAEERAAKQASAALHAKQPEAAPATARAALDSVREALASADKALAEVDAPVTTEGLLRAALDAHDADLEGVRLAAYAAAVREMHRTLHGWIEGAKENCDAMGHRGEANPCWETWHVTDLRGMVGDIARALGVPEAAE